jgi:hypothetical protein
MDRRERLRQVAKSAILGACLLSWTAVAGCLDAHRLNAVIDNRPGEFVQEGTAVVRDGEETQVVFKAAFQTPPRLEVTGFVQSWFAEEPYRKGSFEFVQPSETGFKVRSDHHESSRGSWAEIKWRATGAKARKKTLAEMEPRERVIAQLEKLGGRVTVDDKLPGAPPVGIDLHQTRVTDADLELLHGLVNIRTLNLYGTSITDAGLTHLAGLTGLQTLHLNATAIGDTGLAHLRGLTNLKELNLYQTRVTDEGLRHVAALTGLQNLTLGGKQITDQGLTHLRTLRELRTIYLSGTGVTDAGVREMQKIWPRIQVVR